MKVFFDIITNHTADVISYEQKPAAGRTTTSRRTPSRTRPRRATRSTTATSPAPAPSPRSTPDDELPVHAGEPGRQREPRRRQPQGPRVAQRRHALPQPRQHDVHRRELPVRRLRRPRRPVHRGPARGRRDEGDLQAVDHRLQDRRLPHRHDEARQRRVLAGLRARRARPREGGGQVRVPDVRRGVRHHEDLHVALHDARQGAGGDRLPVPGRGAAVRRRLRPHERAARLLRRRRLVHGRGLERLPAAHVPGQPRHGPHRVLHPAGQPRCVRRRDLRPRPARPRAHVLRARQPRHLLRRRAGLRRRRR